MSVPDEPWLLLLHQLPPKPDYVRVKVWRRLQALGAVAVRNSVYVLPGNDRTREDFQWLKKEIEGLGGEATLCEARFIDGLTDAQVRALFDAARDSDYAQLAEECREVLLRLDRSTSDVDDERVRVERLRKRYDAVESLDFFAADGRAAAESLLLELEQQMRRPRASSTSRRRYVGCRWVTRPGVGVDRMASAWLIRRFVDPAARFDYKREGDARESDELRYDMADADFTHEGDRCTFEVLVERFSIEQPGIETLARIIHDLDFKDGKFRDEKTAGVAALLRGIERTEPVDDLRLERSAQVFDLLCAGAVPVKDARSSPKRKTPRSSGRPTRRR